MPTISEKFEREGEFLASEADRVRRMLAEAEAKARASQEPAKALSPIERVKREGDFERERNKKREPERSKSWETKPSGGSVVENPEPQRQSAPKSRPRAGIATAEIESE